MPATVAAFDGHNDTLLKLHLAGADASAFLEGDDGVAIDLPRARAGGLAAGMCAIFVPSEMGEDGSTLREPRFDVTVTSNGYSVPYADSVSTAIATNLTSAVVALATSIAADSNCRVEIVRDVATLDGCRADGRFGMVLHLEGAEAVDPQLETLEMWHDAGVRSLGIVWSRQNAFGYGVPFRFPESPDIGPGLTPDGVRLVQRCNELGILLDVSHLNAAGFDDVARLTQAPFVASHSAMHALCPSTRNLTDSQLDTLAACQGLVGINFEVSALRADGRDEPDTSLSELVRHMAYAAERIGVEHVALGSDWDGARMPNELADVAALPALFETMRADGFSEQEIEQIAWGNWRRVLSAVWS